jgi:hypothetical protein
MSELLSAQNDENKMLGGCMMFLATVGIPASLCFEVYKLSTATTFKEGAIAVAVPTILALFIYGGLNALYNEKDSIDAKAAAIAETQQFEREERMRKFNQ